MYGRPTDDDVGRLPQVHELGSLLAKCKALDDVKAVVFIDADNRIEAMDWLRWIAQANGVDWSIHVIATIRHGHYSYRMSGADIRPWVTVVQSSTQKKQAVDHNITLQVALLHQQMQDRPKVPFFIITRDHFALEVAAAMSGAEVDRPCFTFDELTAPLHILSHPSCADVEFAPDAVTVRAMCSEGASQEAIAVSVTQSALPFDFCSIVSQYLTSQLADSVDKLELAQQ